MIARAAVSLEALRDELRRGPAAMAETHREMARMLLAHGQLIHPTRRHRALFEAFVQKLLTQAPDAGKYWEVLLSHARWGMLDPPPPKPLENIDDIEPFRKEWSGYVEAALMEAERAELLGCPADRVSWVDPVSHVEIAHCSAHWRTHTFDRLRELAETVTVQARTDRDRLADQRWVPLFDGAVRVAILDQFLGNGVVAHERENRAAKDYLNDGPHELEWLLGLVNENADAATVSVFTAFDVGRNATVHEADVVRAFDKLWQRTSRTDGLASLQLFLGPRRRRFGGASELFPHDRHIRFDGGPGFSLTAGFDRLRFQRSTPGKRWRLTYIWLPDDVQGLKDDENEARRFTDAPTTFS